MFRTKLLLSAAFLGAALLPTAVQADPPRHAPQGVNGRQHNQNTRINQGLHSGQLTTREAARLEAREIRIRRQEAHLRQTGGHLSPAERARLEREQNRTSRAIYRQKHDTQHRH